MQINRIEFTGEITPAIERVLRHSETDISSLLPTVEAITGAVRGEGETTFVDGEATGARPGRVIRGRRA